MRPPPTFQEYAPDMLASTTGMSLEEKGLLATLRWKCWMDKRIPKEPARIAALIGNQPAEIERALTKNVLRFFTADPEFSDYLICVELEEYRAEQQSRREINQKNGAKGGKVTGGRLSKPVKQLGAPPPEMKRNETNVKEVSRDGFSRKGVSLDKSWLEDYETYEEPYL